jgi:hypothetical protein
MRTVGTTQDTVRYMYVDLSAGPPAAHELLPQQTGAEAAGRPASRLFPHFRGHCPGFSCDFRERPVPAHA